MKKNQLFALSCLAVMMTMSACAESNIKAPLEETSCRADSECQAVDPEGTCNLITGLCVLGTCGNARIDEGEACDGAVAADASCPSGMVGTVSCSSACQLDVSKCQKAEECLYPEPKCDGSVWHYCEGQANHSITCGSGQYIAKPKCEDLMGCVIDTDCEDGARSCNGNQPQICESGVWQKYGSVCEFGCNNTTGECNTEEVSCSAGSTQCNGSRVQTCNGSTWIDGDDCSYGCDNGICKNEEGVCEEGKKLCNGSVPMICSDNAWQILDACTYGCSEGACKEQNRVCEEGKKQCNGSIVQTCTDNAWVSGDTCQFGCTEGSCNGQYSVCEEGKKQCNGSIVQTCAGNTWVNGESCTYGCKAGGTCADESDECKDEARQCNGSTPMVCEEGKWKSEAECKYGCSGGVCNNEMAVCNSGQKQCNGAYPMQCTDNSWKTGSRCEFGCNASTGECYAEQSVCTENARQCNGSSIDVCRSNKWEREDTCKFGCSAGNCNTEEAACKTGSKQCNGSYPQSCVDSKWVDGTICQYGCKDGACNDSLVECSPGAKQCNGAYVQTCSSSSKWTTAASACTYGCTNGACNESVTECTTGAVQCNGSTVQKCSASGKWANSESCTFGCTNGICNVELRNCEEGEVKCNGAYVQTCKDNTIVLASAPCDYGCSGGKCLEATKICTPGAKKCNGLLVQTCKSDGLAWSVDESCSAGCTDGVCENACESGAVTCEGKQPKKCSVLSSGNVWVNDGSACTYGCEASTGSCTSAKACTGLTTIDNGNSGCVDSSNYGTCSNGSWTSKKSCAGGCISNTCYAACKPNAQECVSASSIKICKSDGSGWETSSCPSAASICDSTTKTCRAPGNCTIGGKIVASGSKGCDGQKVYSCSDGKSSEVTTCSSSQNCSNGACVNKGQCTSYYSKAVSSELMGCVSDTAYDLCNDGSWLGADTACTTTVANALPVCDSTKEGGNSVPCSFKCKSGYTLKDGVCVGNPCTDYEGNTIESDTFGCSSSTIYHACVGGAWSSDAALSEVCTTDKDNATAVCKNKECTFECNAGYTLTDGACVSSGACVSTPASVKSSDLKSSFGTKTNSYAATAEYTIPGLTGVTASIKGNYNSSNNYLYLRHTDSSYITVSTLPCISKVTINTKYQKTGVKLTVTAGSYSEQKTVPSSFTDLVFEVTDSSATSFTISESGTVSSAAIVSSFGWE